MLNLTLLENMPFQAKANYWEHKQQWIKPGCIRTRVGMAIDKIKEPDSEPVTNKSAKRMQLN